MPEKQPRVQQAWLATVSVVVGFVLTWLGFALVITVLSLLVGLAVTIVLVPVLLAALTATCRMVTTGQRARFAVYLGEDVPAAHSGPAGSGLRKGSASPRGGSSSTTCSSLRG